jgi:Zn-dependent protease with chaperone function
MTKLWAEFFIALGAGTALLVCAAFILQHFTASAAWRRIVWHACFVAAALLLCCELGGARWATGTLFKRSKSVAPAPAKSELKRPSLSPPVFVEVPLATLPTTASTSNITPSIKPEIRPNPLQSWWPGVAWMDGVALFALLAVSRRILLFLFRRRCGRVEDPTVLAQIESLARQLGLERPVPVIQSARLISPIAFGVLRPTICLPANFKDLFSPSEQEAVLVHELAHIGARDPLWQCFSEVITALFWWHPLVWWARHELRYASEAAADEVSLMLANGPKVLAECLVNLGTRFTDGAGFKALGIQGVRFRSGLGRRVQKLFLLSKEEREFAPPAPWRSRSAQFLAPTLCVALIVGCSAWAATIKKGENMKSWKQSLAGFAAVSLLQTLQVGADPATKPNDSVKIAATKGAGDSGGVSPASGGTDPLSSKPQRRSNAATNTSFPKLSDLNIASKNAQLMRSKLENIVLDQVSYDGLPLGEVIKNLIEESARRDPEKRGVNFIFAQPRFELVPAIDPATGLPGTGAAPEPVDLRSTTIRIEPPLRKIRLIDLLEIITRVADRPIEYTIHEYGVVFTAAPPAVTPGAQVIMEQVIPTEARTFKVDPINFFKGLERTFGVTISAQSSDEIRTGLAHFLAVLGVDVHSPNRAVFYNDLTGTLLVRASADEMNLIIAAMDALGANGLSLPSK